MGAAEVGQGGLLQGEGAILGDHLGTGEHGDVLKHRLAAVAEARGTDGGHLEHAAGLVDHQGGQGLTLDLLGEDHQRPAAARDRLQHRHQIGHNADLAVGDQQQRVVEHALAPLLVGDEIRGGIATIEGHPLGDLQLGRQRVGLLHGDHAIGAHLLHGGGDHAAHLLVVAGTDGGHLPDRVTGDADGMLGDARHDAGGRPLHAAAQLDGIGAGCHIAEALLHHRLSQNRGGGGAVTGAVLGLGGHLLDQLGSEVLEGILQLDLAGDGDAVVDDVGGAVLLLEHDVAAARADRHLDRLGQGIDALLKGIARVIGEADQLGHRGEGDRTRVEAPSHSGPVSVIREPVGKAEWPATARPSTAAHGGAAR